VTLPAPVPRPGKVLCSGINYRSHAAENPKATMPTEPFFFAKLPTSIVSDGVAIEHPRRSRQVNYEVEFAAVIGRRLHRAAEADAMAAVFGYTLLNDISARDVQMKDNQITLGKNFDGFAPVGPCVTIADALPHPDRVRLRSVLNGRVMQDGTPAGVGLFRDPPVFMGPGDVIAIDAEGIGTLTNHIVAAP
jgi:2,4-diketo-3-deoxy-L-fuconate hydrolase